MDFEWDEAMRAVNLAKHHIDVEGAIGVFEGPVLTRPSDRPNEGQWVAVGLLEGREIAVVYTRRAEANARARPRAARAAAMTRAGRVAGTSRPSRDAPVGCSASFGRGRYAATST